MDRGKSFRCLGVREDATKEQVTAAYERKVARYKGPDYAEEPEYVDKKLRELYAAYQEAYDLAETGVVRTREREPQEQNCIPAEKKKKLKPGSLLAKERCEAEPELRERLHQWMERRGEDKERMSRVRKNERPSFNKPDLSKWKEKLLSIKDEVASQLELDTDEGIANENSSVENTEFFDESFDSGQRLAEDGSVIQPTEQSDADLDLDLNLGEVAKLIFALILIIAVAVTGCVGGSGDDYSYDGGEYDYLYEYDMQDIFYEDEAVATIADESYFLLEEQGENGSSIIQDEAEWEYEEQADQFAQNYWGMESIYAVSEYLFENYGDYATDSTYPIAEQLESIFAFYGFMDLEQASWYDEPYSGGSIEGYADYLRYLNRFYEEW